MHESKKSNFLTENHHTADSNRLLSLTEEATVSGDGTSVASSSAAFTASSATSASSAAAAAAAAAAMQQHSSNFGSSDASSVPLQHNSNGSCYDGSSSSTSTAIADDDNSLEIDVKLSLVKRMQVLDELVRTEKKYVEHLALIVDGYMREIRDPDSDIVMPEDLRGGKERMIFGNVEAIYEWHREYDFGLLLYLVLLVMHVSNRIVFGVFQFVPEIVAALLKEHGRIGTVDQAERTQAAHVRDLLPEQACVGAHCGRALGLFRRDPTQVLQKPTQ